jgi:glucose/arabinose dehydrogenase
MAQIRYMLTVLFLAVFSIFCTQQQPPKSASSAAVEAGQLPKPFQTPSANNPPDIIPPPDGARLKFPDGFGVNLFADNFSNPRWMAVSPNGDVFVAESIIGQVIVLRDSDGDGKAETRSTFATGLDQPFGMAFRDNYLYVANTNAVVRFPYKAGQMKAEGQPEKLADLPGRGYRQHWTRNLIFSPDGSKMMVSVGSETNVSEEADSRRAAVLEFSPDGKNMSIYASGLRNPVGLAFYPGTNTLFATVNERDGLGDDLVPDYLTSVQRGGFYGWPYSYMGSNPDPRLEGKRPDLVKRAIVPDVPIQAHSAALGLVFYTGKQFPAEYQGNAFIALHGSWNRSRRTGYKVVRVRFKDGKPAGGVEDFLGGWMLDENKTEVWGRPVGLAVLPDGSLLVSDDGGNRIWRVFYKG